MANKVVIDRPPYQPNSRVCGPNKARFMQNNNPLYVLKNDNRILVDELSNIHPQWIEAIDVKKDSTAFKEYGHRGDNGVVMVTLKEDSVFLSVEKLLSEYDLAKSFRKLPLYINKKPFPKEQLLLQRSSVTSVGIVGELENGVEEKHIEVTTTDKP